MPDIVDRAVCEKLTKGRAGTRWDKVVEKIWKDLGGDQEEVLLVHWIYLSIEILFSVECDV